MRVLHALHQMTNIWKVGSHVISLKPSFSKKIVLSKMKCSQGLDTNDEASLISDIDGDDGYWTSIENPTYDIFENIFENLIYDVSSEGSVYSETYESCKEEQLEFSYDQSELYLSIYTKDLKQCGEESDGIQLVEVFSQPSSSHIDVPYVLKQLGAYATSYYLISLDDQHDGVVDLPHHLNLYISAIQSWIEAACTSTYQFGKKFDDIIHAYDSPSSPPILDHHVGLHFLKIVSLLWLVTKDKAKFFYINRMLRWLHWIYDYA